MTAGIKSFKNICAQLIAVFSFFAATTNSAGQEPVIFPHPWQIKSSSESMEIKKLAVKNIGKQERLKAAIENLAKAIKVPCTFLPENEQPPSDSTLIVLYDGRDPAINEIIGKAFPDIKINDLGEQGYFLAITKDEKHGSIYISGNTEQGRFYGLQTLKQLTDKDNRTSRISAVADKPTILNRGIPVGESWFGKIEEGVKRLAALKCNFIIGAGYSGKNGGTMSSCGWRRPYTENEIKTYKKYFDLCHQNFIRLSIGISPRGNPPTQYSSDKDINLLVDRMSALYALGARDFSINFDDLEILDQARLRTDEDIRIFDNDITRAHLYFVNQVYSRLKAKHPDIKFRIVPMYYGGFAELDQNKKNYLKTISELPKEIDFISCPYGEENIRAFRDLTGRSPFIWDNFYATWADKGKMPVFTPPISRFPEMSGPGEIKGYVFITAPFSSEDIIMASWRNGADFIWAPERYSARKSFDDAVLRIPCEPEKIPLIRAYADFIQEIHSYPLPPTDKASRMAWIKNSLETLDSFHIKLKNALPPEVFAEVEKEVGFHSRNLTAIKYDQERKPFPAFVQKTEANIKIDGVLDEKDWRLAEKMTGFTTLQGEIAKNQTEAYFLYDKEYLYIGVRLQEAAPGNMKAQYAKGTRDMNVYQDDCVEIFFDVNLNRKTYYHIAVNSNGAVYDTIAGGAGENFNGEYLVECKTGKDSWVLEMAIPFKNFGIEGIRPGMRWNFNIARERWVKPAEVSSYAMLLRNGFHNPSRFWTVEFK